MMEEKSPPILFVMFLLLVSFPSGGGLSSSECSPSATDTKSGVQFLSGIIDKQKAEQSQRQHLEALFNR